MTDPEKAYLTKMKTALERQADVTDAGKAFERMIKHAIYDELWNDEIATIKRALQTADKVDGLVKALEYQAHTQKKQAELLEQRNFRGQVNADTVAHNLKLNAASADKAIAAFRKDKP